MTAPHFTETVLAFPCEGERLLGVVSAPEDALVTGDLGVVIVVGGPQVRAGSHRQFVQLARHLAAQGLPTLRFDVRGMGDSSGPQRRPHSHSGRPGWPPVSQWAASVTSCTQAGQRASAKSPPLSPQPSRSSCSTAQPSAASARLARAAMRRLLFISSAQGCT